MRAGLFLLALIALVGCVNASVVSVYTNSNCTASAVLATYEGVPTDTCVDVVSVNVKLACSDNTSPWTVSTYPTNTCEGTPSQQFSGANADACVKMAGTASYYAKVICNSAAAQSVSALLIVALAFVANKLRL